MKIQEQIQLDAVCSHDAMRLPEQNREVAESERKSIVIAWMAFVLVLAVLLGLAVVSITYREIPQIKKQKKGAKDTATTTLEVRTLSRA
ncbi:hypothetical protein [Variovorax sp. JS1663]|uniref:hypothetical protein n=1 Tax=Variovorax sp. JS1663 TaxID=1851577 RepID=UPI0011805304|nr:hypothetical protein [Variovorax sp. JS1663]